MTAYVYFNYIMCGFDRRSVFECADRYAVPVVFREHVADAFAFGVDAVGCNAVFLDKSLLNGFGTCGSELFVEFEVAVLRCVAFDDYL